MNHLTWTSFEYMFLCTNNIVQKYLIYLHQDTDRHHLEFEEIMILLNILAWEFVTRSCLKP